MVWNRIRQYGGNAARRVGQAGKSGYQNYIRPGASVLHQNVISPTLSRAGGAATATTGFLLGAGANLGSMAAGKAAEAITPGFWIVLSIGVIVIDWIFGFRGLDWFTIVDHARTNIPLFLYEIITNALFIVIGVWYTVSRVLGGKANGRAMGTFLLMLGFSVIILTSGGLIAAGLFHTAFAIVVYIGLIKKLYPEESQANLHMIVFLFCDFFLFSILNFYFPGAWISNRFYLPIPFLLVVAYTLNIEKSWFTKVVVSVIILIYISSMAAWAWSQQNLQEQIDESQKAQAIEIFRQSWANVLMMKNQTITAYQREQNRLISRAVGDEYYNGQVDRKAKEKLGVYIENVQGLSEKFYTVDDVVFEAHLTGQTLDDPIMIDPLTCYAVASNKADTSENRIAGEITPTKMEIFSYEDDFLVCTFPEGTLNGGSYRIVFGARFGFVTQAYLKSYFMQEDLLRTMRRDDIDPFKQFGIQNPNPQTIHTVGPVEIGISFRNPPVGLSEDEQDYPLGFTIKSDWDGKLNDVESIVLIMPSGFTLKPDDSEELETYCGGYTVELIGCDDAALPDRANLDNWCDTRIHTLYKIVQEGDVKKIISDEDREINADIGERRSVYCRVQAEDREAILENSPLATASFKVIANYEYTLEATKPLTVYRPPGQAGEGEAITANCDCSIPVDASYPIDIPQTYLGHYTNPTLGIKSIVERHAQSQQICPALITAILTKESSMGTNIGEHGIAGCKIKSSTNHDGQVECAARSIKNGLAGGSYENSNYAPCGIAADSTDKIRCVFSVYNQGYYFGDPELAAKVARSTPPGDADAIRAAGQTYANEAYSAYTQWNSYFCGENNAAT